jgi:hypothetical protein
MSESDDVDETDRVDGPGQIGRPPAATADVYREGDDVAGVVRVGDATLVLGYAADLADGLAGGTVVPTHYVDVAPAVPESYVAALHVSGARIHDAVDLRERADGLYADGFSVDGGAGVVPCNPPNTVLVRLRDRSEPVDLLFSNAPDGEAVAGDSLSGALPVYGTAGGGESSADATRDDGKLGDDEVTGRDPDGPATVVTVGDRAATLLEETEGVAPDVVVEARDGTRVVVDGNGTVTTWTADDRRENGSTDG